MVTELNLVSDLGLVLSSGGSVLVSWVGGSSGWSLGGWVLCELLGDLSWLGVVVLLGSLDWRHDVYVSGSEVVFRCFGVVYLVVE